MTYLIIFVLAFIVGISASFIYSTYKNCCSDKRLEEVSTFVLSVINSTYGYLYYCKKNDIGIPITILPEGKHFEYLFQLMSKSDIPLTLQNWFDSEQIDAINIGNDIIADLYKDNLIECPKDILTLLEQEEYDTVDIA